MSDILTSNKIAPFPEHTPIYKTSENKFTKIYFGRHCVISITPIHHPF
jgi:hypothetical protein